MEAPYYDSDLIQALQLCGEYIGRSDHPEHYVTWILFLIDEIKELVSKKEYAAMLAQLNSSVVALEDEVNR